MSHACLTPCSCPAVLFDPGVSESLYCTVLLLSFLLKIQLVVTISK